MLAVSLLVHEANQIVQLESAFSFPSPWETGACLCDPLNLARSVASDDTPQVISRISNPVNLTLVPLTPDVVLLQL